MENLNDGADECQQKGTNSNINGLCYIFQTFLSVLTKYSFHASLQLATIQCIYEIISIVCLFSHKVY